MASGDISERGAVLLKALVERHIRDGQPVGSRTLMEEAGLPVSAATIRNVMSDLEERGYLHSPHTSAGRVPTAAGYRKGAGSRSPPCSSRTNRSTSCRCSP